MRSVSSRTRGLILTLSQATATRSSGGLHLLAVLGPLLRLAR